MNAQKLDSYLKKLGKSQDELIREDGSWLTEFIEVYPGALSVYLRPAPGLNLRFWAEDKRFESVIISIASTATSKTVYQHKLPQPFDSCITREQTLKILGDPVDSKGPFMMPLPMGKVGGWDKFDLAGHAGLVVIVKYDVALNVIGLSFALKESGYDRMRDQVQHPADS